MKVQLRCLALASLLVCASCASPETQLRGAVRAATGVVQLPAGVIEISAPLELSPQAHDLKIAGHPSGTELRAAASFQGEALLLMRSGERITISGVRLDGNRAALERPVGLPPPGAPFARYYRNNGIVAENISDLVLADLEIRDIANFAVIVAGSRGVRTERITVRRSGSRFPNGRNNTTGGILLEEGVFDFRVENSRIENVRGNGIWTHSWRGSPRNERGMIRGNSFEMIARDAIQIGHAVDITVEGNTGRRIGYPIEDVDVEGGGDPVAIDTAGNVERSTYAENRFEEINGKCIDLDGFHHGEVRGNVCTNSGNPDDYPSGNFGIAINNTDPDMKSEYITIRGNSIEGALYGGIFLIGSHHVVENNKLRNLNLARCAANAERCSYRRDTEPDFLRSGIYLAAGAGRPDPARGNRIANNEIAGYGMERYCVMAAPGVPRNANQIHANQCREAEAPETAQAMR
jgi:hypothetical protein